MAEQYNERMSRLQFYTRSNMLMKETSQKYGIPVYFDPMLYGSNVGGEVGTKDGFTVTQIHMNNSSLYARNDLSSSERHSILKVPTIMYIDHVYNLKHEEQHAYRFQQIHNGVESQINSRIACEHLAIMNNPIYYGMPFPDNYSNGHYMISEIDAENAATMGVYQHCYDMYGDRDLADRLTVREASESPYGGVNKQKFDKCEDIVTYRRKQIQKVCDTNMRRYPTQSDLDYRKVKDNPDYVNKWFDKHMDPNFDRSTFPDYFKTSMDADKFVMAATNEIQHDKGCDKCIEDYVEGTGTLQHEGFCWDTSVYKNMFENEEPSHQFDTNAYIGAEGTRTRGQIMGDEAHEKAFPVSAREERENPFSQYNGGSQVNLYEPEAENSSFEKLMSKQLGSAQSLADSKGLSGMDVPDMDIDLGL